MSTQLALFARVKPLDKGARDETLDERFARFHALNPHVYRAFVSVARAYLRATGRSHVGAKMIFEKLRWEYALRTTDADPALDNSYVSRYARMAAANELDLRHAFAFRRLRSAA